jgi:hypothetical protein
MSKAVCVHCRHQIDAAARLCPYCGADPATGNRVDTKAILDEAFHRREVSTSESVLEFARRRQGVIITVSGLIAFLLLGTLLQWASMRNRTAVNDAPAVALTEITDINNQSDETEPAPMPKLTIQYDGRAQTMRTFIVESGAVPPPEVLAAQQAAAQQQQRSPGTGVPPKPASAGTRPH